MIPIRIIPLVSLNGMSGPRAPDVLLEVDAPQQRVIPGELRLVRVHKHAAVVAGAQQQLALACVHHVGDLRVDILFTDV